MTNKGLHEFTKIEKRAEAIISQFMLTKYRIDFGGPPLKFDKTTLLKGLVKTNSSNFEGRGGNFFVGSGFDGAAFSVPLVFAVPLFVLVLLKWFLPEVTLACLVQGVLRETFTITVFGNAGREGSRRLQMAMAVFHLCLHTSTTIFVLASS